MSKYILIVILLIGAFIRIWNLQNNPHGFFVDEASAGLNAYDLLKSGKDEHGKAFPVIFEAVGDYRDPVMIYSTIPFVAVFGLSEFSVRLTSAFYGIAAILMMYLLLKSIAGVRVALLSALLLAISPWHVQFSRVGFQLIASVFWVLFTLYFLLKTQKGIQYYLVAALGMILTFFSYSATKIYLLPLALSFFVSYPELSKKLVKNKYFWLINLAAIGIVTVLIFPSVKDGTFFKRWTQIDEGISMLDMGKAYLNHFSSDFLFISGDAGFAGQDVSRHSIVGVGELYNFQLPFLIVSVIGFFTIPKLKKKLRFFILFLLLYPVGSIFISKNPEASRSILGVIPFTVLTAIGIDIIFSYIKTRIFRLVLCITLGATVAISLFLFVIALIHYPEVSSDYWGWQYGYRPIMAYFKEQEKKHDELLITHRFNMGQELLTFYNVEYKCKKCKVMNNPMKIDAKKKQLFALRQDDLNEATKLYPKLQFQQEQIIQLPDGRVDLYIGSFISSSDK